MAAQQRASGLVGRAQSLLNAVVSPATRRQFYDNVGAFMNDQPVLASFVAIQIFLSFLPVALFLSFALGTLGVALISATLFSLFWVGVALLFLVPTLFTTVGLGIVIWIWAVTSFMVARWIYNVIPVTVRGRAEAQLPNGKKVFVTKSGANFGDVKSEVVNTNSL